MADRDGHDRSASRAKGRFRASIARRHVPGRRFPSQWRVPFELWPGIFRAHGNIQTERGFRFRPLRYLRLVFAPGPNSKFQQELRTREAANLERLRGASQLRRILAAPSRDAVSETSQSAKSQRGGLVGPGRFLRAVEDLRDARKVG